MAIDWVYLVAERKKKCHIFQVVQLMHIVEIAKLTRVTWCSKSTAYRYEKFDANPAAQKVSFE